MDNNEKTNIIKKPSIAVVGRTNVGKSTLFNRIIEESKAIVSPIPGTTRSPNYGDAIWRGRIFTIIDTGGLEKRTEDPFEADIRHQASRAMEEADVIVFVVDLRIGITPEDRDLSKLLFRSKKPMILAGNKAEQEEYRKTSELQSWRGLGAGYCLPISAATGLGVGDLLDEIFKKFKTAGREPKTIEEELHPVKVVIVGKPNVGKSSLLNALVDAPRAVVSEIAHTTREPQDTLIRIGNELFMLVDTAGIRKKLKTRPTLEAIGVRKTLESIKKADVALFLIDLSDEISTQDKHLAGLLLEAGVGIIIVGNKWDLIADKNPASQTHFRETVKSFFPFIAWAPIIFASAKTGEHVQKIFRSIVRAQEMRKQEITPTQLDHFLRKSLKKQRPVRGTGVKHPFIYDMKQVETEPPTFMVAVRGRRESVHPSYLKFLENQLREYFNFEGTPVVIKSKAIRPTI